MEQDQDETTDNYMYELHTAIHTEATLTCMRALSSSMQIMNHKSMTVG